MTQSEIDDEPPTDLQHASEASQLRKAGILESVGNGIFSAGSYAFNKATDLPFPIGSIVAMVEELIPSHLMSLARFFEENSLQALSYVDLQLESVSNMIEMWIKEFFVLGKEVATMFKQTTKSLMSSASDKVQGLGFVDYAADLLVDYEIVVKTKTDSALNVVLKLPGFNTLMNSSGIPLAMAWLLNTDVDKQSSSSYNENKQMLLQDVLAKSDLDVGEEAAGKKKKKFVDVDCVVEEKKEPKENVIKNTAADEQKQQQRQHPRELTKLINKIKTEGDGEEADELSKLIDATWCLGSPRH